MNANAAVVVPPTPIQGNQQNGNAVAPSVDTNHLLTMFMEQQRRNDEEQRRNDEERRRYEEEMKEERRRNDEERRRNDDNFQTQNNNIASLCQTSNILVKEMADVKLGLNTLETNQAGMETEISGLQAGHATLETKLSVLKADQAVLKADHQKKIDFLMMSIRKKKGSRYSLGDSPDSEGTSGKSQ